MAKLSKKSTNVITLAVFFLLAVFVVIYIVYNSRKVLVPAGTVGATAGNINNDGLFCESEGKVYFANSYDDDCLYVMNPDQSEIKKLYNNLSVKYINAGGKYVFFYGDVIPQSTGLGSVVSKPGMYMIEKNGTKIDAITKGASGAMLLIGDNIYYQSYSEKEGTTFSLINVKKQESQRLLDYMINPASLYGDDIYYNGMYDDHHLYTFSLSTSEVTDIWGGDCWYPVCDGDYVYYMDVKNDYRLCRYSISNNTIEILANERLDGYNLYNGVIYYSKSSTKNPQLKRVNADGSDMTVIADGVFNSINITSTYTYFKEFGDDYTTYFTPTYGAPNVQTFEAAKNALYANIK